MTAHTIDRKSAVALREPAPRHSLAKGRLLVAAAILLSAFTLRIAVVSFSPLASAITADLGLPRVFVGVFGMLPTALFASAGLFTPWLIARFGLERTALLAMLATGGGVLARSFAPDGYSLMALSAVALAGMGCGNVVIPPLVKRYFSDRLGTLSALYITVLQLGTIVPAFVAVPLADASNWRESIGVWAFFGFAAALPWLSVVRGRHGNDTRDRTETTDFAPGPAEKIQAWKTPVGWGMAVMFGMTALIIYSMFAWVSTVLTDAGAGKSFAGSMVGVFGLVGLVPSLMASAITRIRNPYPVVLVCALGYAAGFTGLLTAPMAAPLLWVILIGIGPSTFPMTLVLINVRSRTQAGSAALSGFAQGIGYVIGCLGPLLFGVLHTATGGWGAPFGMLGVAVVCILIAGWFACRPGYVED